MIDRDALLDKVRALLSKTTENGCTEAEAFAALDKARAMIDAYVISDNELALTKEEKAMLRTEPDGSTDQHHIKWQLSYAIEQFCNVKIWRNNRNKNIGGGCFAFCGLSSDAQFAEWLMDHLTDFVHRELYAHLVGSLAPRDERREIVRGFVIGACERISDRMTSLCEQSRTEQTSNGRELVVVKNAAIDACLKENGIHLHSCSGGSGGFNPAAREAGYKAGGRATFGRPVAGSAGVLRLGKK